MTGAIFTGTLALPTSVSVLSNRISTTTSPNSKAVAVEFAVILSRSISSKLFGPSSVVDTRSSASTKSGI